MRLRLLATLVFLSYSHKDTDMAMRVARALERAGCEVWTDKRIVAGYDWMLQVEKAIDKADVVVVVASKSAYASMWVRAENLRANRQGKRIVVVVAEKSDIPLVLEGLQRVEIKSVADAVGCSKRP